MQICITHFKANGALDNLMLIFPGFQVLMDGFHNLAFTLKPMLLQDLAGNSWERNILFLKMNCIFDIRHVY